MQDSNVRYMFDKNGLTKLSIDPVQPVLQLILSRGFIPNIHKRTTKTVYRIMLWDFDASNLFSQDFHVFIAPAVVIAPFWGSLESSSH